MGRSGRSSSQILGMDSRRSGPAREVRSPRQQKIVSAEKNKEIRHWKQTIHCHKLPKELTHIVHSNTLTYSVITDSNRVHH
jgi:hypothetical protein